MKPRLLWTVIVLCSLLTSAGAAEFKVAWQRTNNFQSVDFDGLDSPIVKVDGRGNVYVAAVAGRVEAAAAVYDYVVLKRDTDGRPLWQTNIPLQGQGGVRALELDRFGNAYVTGWGGTAKFTDNGKVAWFIPFGDREAGWKDFQDIGVDFAGNVYVTGHSLLDRNSLSTVSITTIKYSPSGAQRWVQHYAGGFIYWSPSYQRLSVDPWGNVYVAGTIRPHPGSGEEWAIIKYNTDGHEVWARSYDRGGFDMAHDIALDRRGHVLVTGSAGGNVTLKYDGDGNRLWEAYQPVAGTGWTIGLDLLGNAYVRGWENDEETTAHFLLKFDSRGRHEWTRQLTSDFGWGHGFAVDRFGNSYLGAKRLVRKFDRRGRHELSISLPHEPSTMDVDHFGRLVVTSPESTTKFISR